jgi:hypothetical protein
LNFSQDVRHVLIASDCAQQHGLGPADQHVHPAQDSCHRKHWKWLKRGKQTFFVKQIALVLMVVSLLGYWVFIKIMEPLNFFLFSS